MNYSVVSEISNVLIRLFKENMVPDVILSQDNIGLCSPDEKGDFSLGIHLYDMEESEEIIKSGMVNKGVNAQTYPSTFVNLYYMITAYSGSDIKFRADQEQKILGKVIQVLNDNPVINAQMLGQTSLVQEHKIKIELQKLDRYEKMKLWNFPSVPYKLSLFYKVYPIEIASAKERKITRVTDLEFVVREGTVESK